MPPECPPGFGCGVYRIRDKITHYNNCIGKRPKGCPIETEEFAQLKEQSALKYLAHVKRSVGALEAAAARLEAVKGEAAPKGVSYDGLPKGKGTFSDTVPVLAAKLEIYQDQYEEQARATRETLDEAARAFAAMPNPSEAMAIELRHVYGYCWARVGRAAGYSERWCQEHEHRALRDLYGTMPHEWRIPAQPAI